MLNLNSFYKNIFFEGMFIGELITVRKDVKAIHQKKFVNLKKIKL